MRTTEVLAEGLDIRPEADHGTQYDEIGPGYFQPLGVPLISGRDLTAGDSENAPTVAIVNEQFARKFGLGRDAVGKRTSRGTPALDVQIVGLVRDFKHTNLRDAAPMYFLPHRQGTRRPGLMTFYVRTPASAEAMAPAIRDAVRRLDAHLPVEDFRTMEDALHGARTRERLMSVMTGSFALLATLIAAIGLYGMLAYAVAQRTPEIGLRMALGATRARVRWMILRQVLAVAIVGGAIGLATAMFLGRAAQTLLFGLQFSDAVVLVSSAVGLTLVALAAGLVPADRAARVDPVSALKYE